MTLVAHERAGRQRDRGCGGDRERRRVDQERDADARDGDHDAADSRPDEPGRGAYELVERVRLREQLTRNDLRDDRAERGSEERLAEAPDADDDPELPQRQVVRHGKDTANGGRDSAERVGHDHHVPAVHPVAEYATGREEEDGGREVRRADPSERGRVVGELVGLPRVGDEEDEVADERGGRPGPEQREVADA